jgi:hydroxymethylbilane synthase
VSRRHRSFADLPSGAVIATGSLRRRAQILHRRPDLHLEGIRGNIGTRLLKLEELTLDGLVLAQAGLQRLGREDVITEILDPSWMLPAVGQGALGLECRADDWLTLALLQQINDRGTSQAVLAERALLRGLGGGCQVPVGALTTIAGEQLTLRGVVLSPDGKQRIEAEQRGPLKDAESLGSRLADQLRAQGASDLLSSRQ